MGTKRDRLIRSVPADATNAVPESVGPAHRSPPAERADAAVHRPASHPRSDEPAGVRRAGRARLAGEGARAHVRDRRSHRAHRIAGAAVRRSDGRDDDVGARTELPRARHSAVRSVQRDSGHRPRHRAGTWPHATRHDDLLRRQPHVDARRVWRHRVRHRHVAGARRAGVTDAWRIARSRFAASTSRASWRRACSRKT